MVRSPPVTANRSTSTTLAPDRAAAQAADTPAMPPPMHGHVGLVADGDAAGPVDLVGCGNLVRLSGCARTGSEKPGGAGSGELKEVAAFHREYLALEIVGSRCFSLCDKTYCNGKSGFRLWASGVWSWGMDSSSLVHPLRDEQSLVYRQPRTVRPWSLGESRNGRENQRSRTLNLTTLSPAAGVGRGASS